MAGNRPRRSHAKRPQHQGTPPVVPRSPAAPTETDADQAVTAALEEIQSVLDMPLSELVDTEEERAEAEELTRQARVVPAMARLRELVDFVGRGRPATQAGNRASSPTSGPWPAATMTWSSPGWEAPSPPPLSFRAPTTRKSLTSWTLMPS